MSGFKRVLNWFVTVETDETQPAPPEAASPDADTAAKAARAAAEQGNTGKTPATPRRVGEVRSPQSGKTLEQELAELDAELAREGGGAPSRPAAPGRPTPPSRPAPPPRPAPPRAPSAESDDDLDLDLGAGLTPRSFEELYEESALPGPTEPGFTVYKVEELLGSPHLKGLSAEMKRASLLVAMQASGVNVESVIADAFERDRALDAHDDELQITLDDLESQVRAQNSALQAEAEAVLMRLQQQIAQNNARLEEARATYAEWKQEKQGEERRLHDAIALFIAPGQKNPVTL